MFKLFLVVLAAFVSSSLAQRNAGECPINPDVSVCTMTCFSDSYCQGLDKCCRTACGGTTCLPAITSRTSQNLIVKNGVCPNPPTGPWVCSSRCNFDGDCKGRKKCCKNRCGAMACVTPEVFTASPYLLYQ